MKSKREKEHETRIQRLKIEVDQKKTACECLEEMLGHEAVKRKQTVHGSGVGTSTSGNAVFTNSTANINSLDEDTNRLLRTDAACRLGLFKSPLSTDRSPIYVNEDNYISHREITLNKITDLENNPPKENCLVM